MTDPSSNQIAVQCPNCKARLRMAASSQQRKVACPRCNQHLLVGATSSTPPPAAASPPTGEPPKKQTTAEQPRATPPAVATGLGNCMICQCPVQPQEATTTCPGCDGLAHQECWEYNQGCGKYGCQHAPPTEGLDSLEIPPSHWGKEEKQCPKCRKTIKAAAQRCKHCGATFDSNPESSQQYSQREASKRKIAEVRVAAIVILIAGIIPCTAPMVAVAGPVWYGSNRDTIKMLPGVHSALCKIGIVASIAITVLLIVVAVASALSPVE